MTDAKRLYVLDSNVLIHDPMALLRFEEHDVFIPLQVLEALDHEKRGATDLARNVREVSVLLDSIIADADATQIAQGIALPGPAHAAGAKLFLQTRPSQPSTPSPFATRTTDNQILDCALALVEQQTGSVGAANERRVILVSRNINLRIKARSVGLAAEDYHSDRVIEDLSMLPSGMASAPTEVLRAAAAHPEASTVRIDAAHRWHPHLGLYHAEHDGLDARVISLDEHDAQIQRLHNYRAGGPLSVWGIQARNREQNFALNLLMDETVDLVTLLGAAGTGKTLLTLAAGLAQTLDQRRYEEIIVTRATIAVGDDIGYLPGTEEEKMTPWMGALMDNLEVLARTDESVSGGAGDWGRKASSELISQRIKLRSLSFMRGRTFLSRFVIIDEAQNLSRMQMKTLITRAGPGSKIVCLGNIAQIDAPYISETTSGLTYAVERFKAWAHAGHVTLARGERSRLADYANDAL